MSLAAGAVGVIGLVGAGLTAAVLALEAAQHRAGVEAARQADLRLALWRMDSWVAPRLATEAARPHTDYEAFHPVRQAYTSLLNSIEPGRVVTPSPLLAEQNELVLLHFQVAPDGAMTSPQAPQGNLRDLTEDFYIPHEVLKQNEYRLSQLNGWLPPEDLDARLPRISTSAPLAEADGGAGRPAKRNGRGTIASRDPRRIEKRSQAEARVRRDAVQQTIERFSQSAEAAPGREQQFPQSDPDRVWFSPLDDADAEATMLDVGPLWPAWFKQDPGRPALVFARRVLLSDGEHIQGFWVDWDRLRRELLAQIADLFPDAVLTPAFAGAGGGSALQMATLPVWLLTPDEPMPLLPLLTPVRAGLLVGWAFALAGAASLGLVFKSVLALGEKRGRFASAVTHELRTPLTTFRLYTEMLADGMVTDEAQQREYLSSLKDESARLAALVENVLSYARIEDGRSAMHRRAVRVGELLDRALPSLERRVEAAGARLALDPLDPPPLDLHIDPDAAAQILLNLVDNACKYGGAGAGSAVRLEFDVEGAALAISVCDDGPGVPPAKRETVFRPFERADESSPAPGLGLGLAISRALARDMGGDLELRRADRGARFTLTLPLA